ncbi:NADP-dependent oxidoreductase [Nocardia bhagyanarayanae]|uniref:NADPH:quinone reductase-like Zn-dependent oxidoreductase n=1 Tax=Nocardia bhagyanarayanae TaxID=1215925 RepID=A0A543F7Y7_9NOCA|nr:NADP-dependent oxidoreductase [Nocardia bhagyanarayanae]TQM29948.1 NADPH:quinone reductase-like Zn-dependent oxidoreductase [Nocardia bhagyanarayanae]
MRAIVVRKFGEPVELAEMPVPEPGAQAVKVQLDAAGVNPFDLKMANGILEGRMPHDFPAILGVDGAGSIASVGPGVTKFTIGDRVVGKFLVPPAGHGSFAEYSVLPEDATLVPIPEPVTTMAAAALPTAGVTAQDLVDAAQIRPGQKVLIVGATGGVGSFLVQLANIAGAHVIATARGDTADQMTRLGAAETVDYTRASVADSVRSTEPDGIDVLFDLVSPPEALAPLTELVRAGGAVYTTVFAADEAALRERGLRGGNFESKGRAPELTRLLARVAAGDVVVPIDATVPLEEASTVLGATGARGKTVLTI